MAIRDDGWLIDCDDCDPIVALHSLNEIKRLIESSEPGLPKIDERLILELDRADCSWRLGIVSPCGIEPDKANGGCHVLWNISTIRL